MRKQLLRHSSEHVHLLKKRFNLFSRVISVDCFYRYTNLPYYFLSHYHFDHMSGLQPRWNRGVIYCSHQTARFLVHLMGVAERLIVPVLPHTWHELPGGILFNCCPANHCPGALMFAFKFKGKTYMHTGDFRLNTMIGEWLNSLGCIDFVVADDTYWSTHLFDRYNFPAQEEVIANIVGRANQSRDKEILIGTYTIGKEKVLYAISRALQKPVYVPKKRLITYKLQSLDYITNDRASTNIRAYSMGYLLHKEWQKRYDQARQLVIIPTGWRNRFASSSPYYFPPYSEHCSTSEFARFLDIIKPSVVRGLVSKELIE